MSHFCHSGKFYITVRNCFPANYQPISKGHSENQALLRIVVSGMLCCFLHVDENKKADVGICIKHFIIDIVMIFLSRKKTETQILCLELRQQMCQISPTFLLRFTFHFLSQRHRWTESISSLSLTDAVIATMIQNNLLEGNSEIFENHVNSLLSEE